MANNYHYIVAGLPDFLLDFEAKPFDCVRVKEAVIEQLEPKERRWTDWLALGLQPHCLSSHFYRAVGRTRNPFIHNYFTFDKQLRNILAAFTARKDGVAISSVLVGNDEITEALLHSKAADFGLKSRLDFAPKLFSILEEENILEREHKLDRLRWDKANEACVFHYFDINVVLCFLLKVSILERWFALDRERGQELFQGMVQEMRKSDIL